ncbi:MAG: hypothetical protein LBK22_07085, partial [Tannerella sp.]|nr:hypothetical protein [Tannerella sp.]
MKTKLLFLVFAGLLSLTPSCINDVLDKKPLDIISEEVVWNDGNLVDSYLANKYGGMAIFQFDLAVFVGGDYWAQHFGFLAVSTVS